MLIIFLFAFTITLCFLSLKEVRDSANEIKNRIIQISRRVNMLCEDVGLREVTLFSVGTIEERIDNIEYMDTKDKILLINERLLILEKKQRSNGY